MEISHTLIEAIWRPHFLFKYPYLKDVLVTSDTSASLPWESSALNPKNRIDSLRRSSTWRIDGATVCGTHFFVVPTSLLPDLAPLRLDLYVPDQNSHPVHLRDVLESSISAPLRDLRRISRLGISRHLCQALDAHCRRNPDFLEEYSRLPFATRLVFERIESDAAQMELVVIPWHEVESQAKSVSQLQALWELDISPETWPEAICLSRLQLVRQIHDSVSVVKIASASDVLFAFKSTVENLEFVYHELKFLLTIPPHAHIMPPPPFIVTKRSLSDEKEGVVGFLLPYYPSGSIRDTLVRTSLNDSISMVSRLRWCYQITSALAHVYEKGGTFYSDLRPDNVLLASTTSLECDVLDRVILCDFEQRGNWYEWCAPEILHHMYAENIRSTATSQKIVLLDRWQRVVESYAQGKQPPMNAIEAKNRAWFSLSRQSQEKAMVYSLGLFMYCLFEGVSNVRVSIANSFRRDPHVEFPTFQHTPLPLQSLIRQCTVDSSEWPENAESLLPKRVKPVIRVGDKLYGAQYKEPNCTIEAKEDVMQTGLKWWTTELERTESFLRSKAWISQDFGRERPTLQAVLRSLDGMKLSSDVERYQS
jgi:hypothetical protein